MSKTIDRILEAAGENDWILVKRAYEIAQEAHKNDTRDGGNPYMDHIDAVLENTLAILEANYKELFIHRGNFNIFLAVAILHDVFEDHPDFYSLIYLEKLLMGVCDGCTAVYIVRILDDLSKRKKGVEAYQDYVKRVCKTEEGMVVKLADLKDNSKDLKIGTNRRDKYDLTAWVIKGNLDGWIIE